MHLRKALTYSIDRRAILDHIIKFGSIMAKAPFPPDYSFENNHFENNQTKLAQEHLEIALKELGLTRDMIQLKLSIHNASNVTKHC